MANRMKERPEISTYTNTYGPAPAEEPQAETLEQVTSAPAMVQHKGEIKNTLEQLKAEGTQKIVVLPDQLNKNETHITVGINGCNFRIKRGVPVEVPLAVIEVLEQSNRTNEYRQEYEDPQTGEMKVRTVYGPAAGYPFTVVR